MTQTNYTRNELIDLLTVPIKDNPRVIFSNTRGWHNNDLESNIELTKVKTRLLSDLEYFKHDNKVATVSRQTAYAIVLPNVSLCTDSCGETDMNLFADIRRHQGFQLLASYLCCLGGFGFYNSNIEGLDSCHRQNNLSTSIRERTIMALSFIPGNKNSEAILSGLSESILSGNITMHEMLKYGARSHFARTLAENRTLDVNNESINSYLGKLEKKFLV